MAGAEEAEQVVKVNAGGTVFETTSETLRRIDFVYAKWNFERHTRDEGTVFVDVDPEVFGAVLELARGRGPQYLQSLPAPLQISVKQQTQEWHMDKLRGFSGFFFELLKSPYAMVFEGKDTPGRKTCVTRGFNGSHNTVFGSLDIPASGTTYFEVEVLKVGKVNSSFGVGIAERKVKKSKNFWINSDGSLLGAGLLWDSSGIKFAWAQAGGGPPAYGEADFPKMADASKIGVFVDMDEDQLAFFLDGKFRVIHPCTGSMKGKTLCPAISVQCDTVLKLHSGLAPPCTEEAFVLE